MAKVVGHKAADAIETIVASSSDTGSGFWSAVLGIVILILGASGVFIELHSAMNTIWKVGVKPGQGLVSFLRQRFFSFAMVLAVAFLLLVSLIASAALSAVGKFFSGYLPGGEFIWQLVNAAVSLAFTTGLFALIFRIVPDVQIDWKDVLPGAFATALLFTLGKSLLALYIGKSSVTSSFGAAGSLVALVIWVYYSSQIVFFGAELTEVYSRRLGGGVKPSEHAVALDPAKC
jgi:membrane protein